MGRTEGHERESVTMRKDKITSMRDKDTGKLPEWAWPGGYPIVYDLADGGICCPDCANNGTCHENAGEREYRIVDADVYWEGPTILCDCCNGDIESAYDDPDENDNDE
jgi:hypothetical protein